MKKSRRINIITLGCSKNTVDSEVLAGQLKAHGFDVVFDHVGDSEAVIINTCGFIGDAKEESVDTILHYLFEKKAGKIKKVFVMGCLIQRYSTEMSKELSDVDGFFGVTDFEKILMSLSADQYNVNIEKRLLSTPSHYAYLKISEGCDRSCSFCAIPLIRGRNGSRTIESLINEACFLADQGVKELNIIAQDTTSYGIDLYGKQMLAQLLSELVKIRKFEWLRLHYAFPAGFPNDVLRVIKENPEICKYIDIPLQHISDKILRSMKRGITAANTRKLLYQFRNEIPDLAIRTAFIVGYPGETQDEFLELINFIKEQQFARAGVFTYSAEEGTPAFLQKDNVPENIKRKRAAELMDIQQEISLKINLSRIGNIIKVIIDRFEGDFFIGRTEYDSPDVDNEVLIPVDGNELLSGNFYMVKITGAEEFDLIGTTVF